MKSITFIFILIGLIIIPLYGILYAISINPIENGNYGELYGPVIYFKFWFIGFLIVWVFVTLIYFFFLKKGKRIQGESHGQGAGKGQQH